MIDDKRLIEAQFVLRSKYDFPSGFTNCNMKIIQLGLSDLRQQGHSRVKIAKLIW